MQIYVIYFVFPALDLSLPPFIAGLAALSFNSAAYVAEIFRAGIESIDTGQREAARALGMTGGQTMRYVILPQTVRRVLPPLTNEAVALLKDSSLVSVVALSELMRVGKEIATTAGAPTTIYLAVALIYLAMTLPLTSLVRYLENRWQPISRPRNPRGIREEPSQY
jgi:ABC-type amino acid transport system permease subunit